MSRPAFLTIKRVKCFSTTDPTGGDEIFGVMGPVRFNIGTFNAGDEIILPEVEHIVPAGEFFVTIKESDTFADDEIGVIDLTKAMDFDTTSNVQGAGGNYDITFFVASVSDGVAEQNEDAAPE